MSTLGPNAGYIMASYGAAALILAGLVATILLDHRTQARALAALDQRGAGRRSGRAAP